MKKTLCFVTLLTLGMSYPAAAQIFVQPDSAKPGKRTITDPRVPQEKNIGGDIFNKPIVVPQASQPSGDVGAQDFESEREVELRSKAAELEEKAKADKAAAQEKLKKQADKVRAGEAGPDDGPSIDEILDDSDIEEIISDIDGDGPSKVSIRDRKDVTRIRTNTE